MHKKLGKKAFFYIMAAYVLTMVVLYTTTDAFGADAEAEHPPHFKYGEAPDVPLSELGPKYHFLDALQPVGVTHPWMLQSNSEDGTHTINFFPKRNIGKSEMQSVHLTACVISTYFEGFTLKGTAFYLPDGLIFGSPCIREDGKGFRKEEWGRDLEAD
ncbi:MAG: hypothetical protein KAJ73_00630 [Zetaproteobacteria bacterium]|nr:hypothetical protein [Zetaproteobacteria bacterium]